MATETEGRAHAHLGNVMRKGAAQMACAERGAAGVVSDRHRQCCGEICSEKGVGGGVRASGTDSRESASSSLS